MRKIRMLGEPDGDDPLHGVANFFDLGIVFALGFLLALMNYIGLPELAQREDARMVQHPGTPQLEKLQTKGVTLDKYRVTKETIGGEGVKLGTAYRLRTGEVVYIPDDPPQ